LKQEGRIMATRQVTRRTFLGRGLVAAGGLALAPELQVGRAFSRGSAMDKAFDISLAAWSVHRMFYQGKLKQIDMPKLCRETFDLGGLELVNSFFPSPQYTYCKNLSKRAADHGVKILLIMCDGEGDMAAADKRERLQAVRNHRKWLDVAAVLGCHAIRCNAGHAQPDDDDAVKRCAESFAALCATARADGIHVLIENHGGMSSDPDWLLKVIRQAADPLLGTLPDFGNFPKHIDRYDAVRRMMPFAKAVSAKCHDFDADGNETGTDYARMMPIVLNAGYHGWIGIEYEGRQLSETEGIKACKRLLQRFQ
jgi:sugar phosphate isomerase/epimerase